MKTVKLIREYSFVILVFIAFDISAQNYSQLSPAVQDKMDQNKIDGKPIMEGIYTHYEVFFWGADTQVKRDILIGILQNNISATSISYDAVSFHFSFVCPSIYSTDDIKNNIIPDYEINNIYKEDYSLSP